MFSHLTRPIIQLGDEEAEVSARGDVEKVADRLGILVSSGCVPEYNTVLDFVWLTESVYHRV